MLPTSRRVSSKMSSHSSMMEGKDEAAADCITLHVPLTNATTIIHFRKLAKEKYPSLFARSSEEEEDGVAEDNEEAEEDLEMEEGDGAGEEVFSKIQKATCLRVMLDRTRPSSFGRSNGTWQSYDWRNRKN